MLDNIMDYGLPGSDKITSIKLVPDFISDAEDFDAI